jgi:hypothetical protein
VQLNEKQYGLLKNLNTFLFGDLFNSSAEIDFQANAGGGFFLYMKPS